MYLDSNSSDVLVGANFNLYAYVCGMSSLNSNQAIEAIRKRLYNDCLIEQGFVKVKTTTYSRLSKGDVLQSIYIMPYMKGEYEFIVEFFVRPLYSQNAYWVLSPGNRFENHIGKTIFSCKDEATSEKVLINLKEQFFASVLPFFNNSLDEIGLIKMYESKSSYPNIIFGDETHAKQDLAFLYLKSGQEERALALFKEVLEVYCSWGSQYFADYIHFTQRAIDYLEMGSSKELIEKNISESIINLKLEKLLPKLRNFN